MGSIDNEMQMRINYLAIDNSEFLIKIVGNCLVRTHENIRFQTKDFDDGTVAARTFRKRGTFLDWQLRKWIKAPEENISRIVKYLSTDDWASMMSVGNEPADSAIITSSDTPNGIPPPNDPFDGAITTWTIPT